MTRKTSCLTQELLPYHIYTDEFWGLQAWHFQMFQFRFPVMNPRSSINQLRAVCLLS